MSDGPTEEDHLAALWHLIDLYGEEWITAAMAARREKKRPGARKLLSEGQDVWLAVEMLRDELRRSGRVEAAKSTTQVCRIMEARLAGISPKLKYKNLYNTHGRVQRRRKANTDYAAALDQRIAVLRRLIEVSEFRGAVVVPGRLRASQN